MKAYIGITIIIICLFINCKKEIKSRDALMVSNIYSCSNIEVRQATNYYICVDSLYESRCPENVVCATVGSAIVKIRFNLGNLSYPLKMILGGRSTSLGLTNDTTINGFRIIFTNVLPYPNTSIYTPINQKIAHFNVTY